MYIIFLPPHGFFQGLFLIARIASQDFPNIPKVCRFARRFQTFAGCLKINGRCLRAAVHAYHIFCSTPLGYEISYGNRLGFRLRGQERFMIPGRRKLYTALADVESLEEARKLYEEGMSGMEEEAARYAEAVSMLENSGVRIYHEVKHNIL